MKVLFGGAFDLLHLGHIKAIEHAKSYGDYLVVNVNSDFQVMVKKGLDRPVIPGVERAEMVKALKAVDEVIYQTEAQGLVIDKLLDLVQPDILVINQGEDNLYTQKAREECHKRGIKIIEQPRVIVNSKLDTTEIIRKIRQI